MSPAPLHDRLEALIDELLSENTPESTSLASLLMTAQESLREGSIVPLSLMVRRVRHDQRDESATRAEDQNLAAPAS